MGAYERLELIEEIEALEAEFGFVLRITRKLTDLPDLQLRVLRDGLAAVAEDIGAEEQRGEKGAKGQRGSFVP